MVDLQGQYHRLKEEIDAAMQTVIESSAFINGVLDKAVSLLKDTNEVIKTGRGLME